MTMESRAHLSRSGLDLDTFGSSLMPVAIVLRPLWLVLVRQQGSRDLAAHLRPTFDLPTPAKDFAFLLSNRGACLEMEHVLWLCQYPISRYLSNC
jgi:hypothetical protein